MSFDSCLTLLQLQDKLPVDVIRETAREYEAEGIKPAEALARAVTEHLDEAKRQEAHIVATVKEKFTASGGKLPEPAAAPVEPKAAKTVAPDETRDTRGTGVRFHGTSRELPGGRPNNEYAMSGDNRNIYGQGFYTTDAADISEGYMKKGKGGSPTLYEVQERGAPKLYDMEQPLTPEVRAMAERVMGDEFPEVDLDGKPVTTLREVFDEYRNESRNFGLTRDEVQEVFDSIRYNLEQQGYAGYRHIGGLKTNKTPHDVRIYWTPEDHLDVEKSDLGKYKGEAAASDPASPDIRYSTADDNKGRKASGELLNEFDIGAALDTNRWIDRGVKLGKAQKVFRGTSERTGRNTANFGRGLYTTTDRKEAAQYGAVAELDRDVLPKNALRFPDEGKFREWESYVAREVFGYHRVAEFEAAHGIPDQWVRELDPSIDGIQIGVGHGAFFVTFPRESGGNYSVESDPLSRLRGEPMANSVDLNILGNDSLTLIAPTIRKLVEGGAVVIHKDASTLPGGKAPAGVQALTTADGTIHLVASSLSDANARGVLLHEAFHSGGEALVGSKAWDGLTRRLGNLYSLSEKGGGTARAFFDAARDRVETAKAKGAVASGMEHEEFGAYAIEEYAKAPPSIRKWVDDLLGHVKAWVLARFGKQLGDVTPSQLSSLAKLALLDVQAARSASHELQPVFSSSREKTIEVDGQRRPIENASGKLIAPDMHQQMNFWRWFGDSTAVDEQGRPHVLYHGSTEDIAAFDPTLAGKVGDKFAHASFFTSSPVVAAGYSQRLGLDPVHEKLWEKEEAQRSVYGKAVVEQFRETKTTTGPLVDPIRADYDKVTAARRDRRRAIFSNEVAIPGANITPVYLRITKPVEVDAQGANYYKTHGAAFEAASEAGADGVIVRNVRDSANEIAGGISDVYAVFAPEQVKSAVGNDGSFSGDTPDIRYSVAGAAPEPVSEEHRSALSKMIGVPKELLKSAAFNMRMAVVPMAAGSEQAMAMAKDFANHNRRAATQWTAFDKVLRNSYSDEQLKKMWIAADQENDLRREGRTSTAEGLASLNAGERRTVELLHAYGEQLWAKARDAGLVTGDGVAFWTPRVAANIVADGSAEAIRQPAGEFSKEARNLRTSAASTKQRKHETTAESEAALKAKLGEDAEYVKNIRVMPMAMAQLEKAIAGRTLVNQIKAHGKLAGDDLVSDEGRPNFVTFDHPALKQYRPKMDWQAADTDLVASRGYEVRADGVYRDGEKLASYRIQDGEVQKLAPMEDSNGKPVMESFPLFVRKDFAGPLKAVFATDQGAIYNGLMSLKGGVTSMIMISPLTHNLVIWGKAMPTMMSTMGWKNNLKNAGTLGMHGYFIGNRARADHALMNELVEAGLVPVSGRGMNQDVTAIANGIQPGRSLTAKALGSVADIASKQAGQAVRRGVDAAGQFWHETLLWDRVADLQAGMAVMMRTSLMDKGLSQDTANRIASHFANRYAGMIPREAMSEVANKIANLSLFSKSFTMTNLGAYKDLIGGLPKDVQAQIKMRTVEIQKALGKGEIEAEQAARASLKKVQSVTRKKAAAVLVLDVAAMAAVTSLAQALWEGQDGKQIAADFKERLAALGIKLMDDPMSVLGHPLDAISSLSQTHDNPHGREDRVRVGEDEEGNTYYARLPVGKVGEELKQYGNLDTGMHLLRNKMSTFLRPIADLTANEDFTGKRIINPHDNIVKQVAAFGAYWVKSQLPAEDLLALGHVVKGDADHMDKLKLMGTATGLSVGRLSGGDAVAELRHANREQQADLRDVLPDVREALRRGDQEKAEQLLEEAGQTPREAMRIMRQIEQPGRISKQSLRKFNQHADDSERARLEKMRSRAQ